ncbi:hypothetical protein BX616_001055 [Lobosporangium transversale]|uniref:LSM domain-containing protein n=1 Tax=Lobosporangium transversale TaxID=64571 RepID=A0A1Y2GZT0_9FUNG|nr:hypothetical protein BCR41DRAFT_383498 [Lobosporangium transversale]KAF9905285.1 hypothetical protein BX616_001055 [Lobosporangium transversale]ORZ27776.1 hypothetical protein BCR41DRAFT_383498 [Lobosporangium transversale]|eukprot:XP_021885479.1 hypothetical protein BCR41DRAFT_383498 [Lobosporangium transversale]
MDVDTDFLEDPPQVALLRSLLNRSTRIQITDGRLFEGQFMCIDHSKNIILASAYESRPAYLNPSLATTTTSSSLSVATQDKKAITDAIANAIAATTTATTARVNEPNKQASTSNQHPYPPQVPPPRSGILKNKEEEERRFVGQIMIPGHHIVKAEMDTSHLRGLDSRIKSTKYDMQYLRGK